MSVEVATRCLVGSRDARESSGLRRQSRPITTATIARRIFQRLSRANAGLRRRQLQVAGRSGSGPSAIAASSAAAPAVARAWARRWSPAAYSSKCGLPTPHFRLSSPEIGTAGATSADPLVSDGAGNFAGLVIAAATAGQSYQYALSSGAAAGAQARPARTPGEQRAGQLRSIGDRRPEPLSPGAPRRLCRRAVEQMVIYELHVGTFNVGAAGAAVEVRRHHQPSSTIWRRSASSIAIELMPPADFSSEDLVGLQPVALPSPVASPYGDVTADLKTPRRRRPRARHRRHHRRRAQPLHLGQRRSGVSTATASAAAASTSTPIAGKPLRGGRAPTIRGPRCAASSSTMACSGSANIAATGCVGIRSPTSGRQTASTIPTVRRCFASSTTRCTLPSPTRCKWPKIWRPSTRSRPPRLPVASASTHSGTPHSSTPSTPTSSLPTTPTGR